VEVLLQVIAEIALQVVLEIVFELGLRRVGQSGARPKRPWLAAIGYTLLGSIAGGISLLLFPAHLLQSPTARIGNLALTPLAAGAAMVALGRWRQRKGQRLIRKRPVCPSSGTPGRGRTAMASGQVVAG